MRGPPGLMLFPFSTICCLLLMNPEEDEVRRELRGWQQLLRGTQRRQRPAPGLPMPGCRAPCSGGHLRINRAICKEGPICRYGLH